MKLKWYKNKGPDFVNELKEGGNGHEKLNPFINKREPPNKSNAEKHVRYTLLKLSSLLT